LTSSPAKPAKPESMLAGSEERQGRYRRPIAAAAVAAPAIAVVPLQSFMGFFQTQPRQRTIRVGSGSDGEAGDGVVRLLFLISRSQQLMPTVAHVTVSVFCMISLISSRKVTNHHPNPVLCRLEAPSWGEARGNNFLCVQTSSLPARRSPWL